MHWKRCLLICIALTTTRRLQVFSQPATPAWHQGNVVSGMNIVNPMRASVQAQNQLIAQLDRYGVHVVRCSIEQTDAKGNIDYTRSIDFARRLYQHGIKLNLLVSPRYPADAPTRPYDPKRWPNMYSGHPLSSASPELSQAAFHELLARLDSNGIELASLELGNEINWAAFNPEFPLPGEGRNFDYDDLFHDPEAKQIATGYLKYLKVMTVLKEERDKSQTNRHTPILSAGLSPSGAPGPHTSKEDSVAINATLRFLRNNGLDNLVDGYGIHVYPYEKTAAERKADLARYDLAECNPNKPCWITEWGFSNKDLACPTDDTARAALVDETMDTFTGYAQQKKLEGQLYFAWDSDPWSTTVDPDSVYRCSELTRSGLEALRPIPK